MNIPIYRVSLVRETSIDYDGRRSIGVSRVAAELVRRYLADVDREYFIVILLDRKLKPIGMNTVSIGSLAMSVVHPREVFKPAILANAGSIICGHNHPSGDCEPSEEDDGMTRRLIAAGQLLGIPLLDHIIIGDNGTYYSYQDNNKTT